MTSTPEVFVNMDLHEIGDNEMTSDVHICSPMHLCDGCQNILGEILKSTLKKFLGD